MASALTPAQQQALKRQTGNIDQFEKTVLQKEYGGIDKAKLEKAAVSKQQLEAFLAKIQDFKKQLTAYRSDLDKNKCPATDPGVKTVQQRLDKADKRLVELEKLFAWKQDQIGSLVDIKKYPAYQGDLARLEGMEKGYTINGSLKNVPLEDLKDLEAQYNDDAGFVNNLMKTYGALIKLQTPEGAVLNKAFTKAAKAMQGYYAKAEAFMNEAEPAVQKALDAAQTTAQRAVQQKQAAMFERGVKQQLNQATEYVGRLQVMTSKRAKELAKTVLALVNKQTKAINTMAASMKEEILANTAKPADVYAGKDKADLEKQIMTAWKKAYPKDKVLGVHFPNKEWVRDSVWRWSSAQVGWYLNDRSVLRMVVAVQTDAKVVTLYQAYMNKDNLSNTLKVGVDTKGGEYVQDEMLLKNY